jgi:hypothetical protein
MHAFLTKFNFNSYENVILPKCVTVVVLRYICEEDCVSTLGEEANMNKWTISEQFEPACHDQIGPRITSSKARIQDNSFRATSSDLPK